MHPMTRLFQRMAGLVLSEEGKSRFLTYLAYATGMDLLSIAHSAMGIGNWGSVIKSGEDRFAREMLPCLLKCEGSSPLTLFDVGANKGEYCGLLTECFPKAKIYAFEPNRKAFCVLEKSCEQTGVQALNFGFSSSDQTAMLSVPLNNLSSSHGTLHSEVFKIIHHASEDAVSEAVKLRTVAGYARDAGISTIDFMKIDTEGHELAVIQGCGDMLRNGAIRVIQFEFNQMNVVSRVFLQDFYKLLDVRYELFRIAPKELVPLGPYHTRNEIFIFQNIVAILKPLAGKPEFSSCIRR